VAGQPNPWTTSSRSGSEAQIRSIISNPCAGIITISKQRKIARKWHTIARKWTKKRNNRAISGI
jgi:hypothetical protein